MAKQKQVTLRSLTKSSIWGLDIAELVRLWREAEREGEFKDNKSHYEAVLRCGFEVEELKNDNPRILDRIVEKYEARGYYIGKLKGLGSEDENSRIAIKKREIKRVCDLSMDNIRYVSVDQLLEVLDRNFGCGWEALSNDVKAIIMKSFEVSTTQLPKDRLHNPGGMYERMMNEDYKALEIERGNWVEVIFARLREVPDLEDEFEDEEEKKDELYSKYLDDDFDQGYDEEAEERRKREEAEDEYDFDEDKFDENIYTSNFDNGDDDEDGFASFDEDFDDLDFGDDDFGGMGSGGEVTIEDIVAAEDNF